MRRETDKKLYGILNQPGYHTRLNMANQPEEE